MQPKYFLGWTPWVLMALGLGFFIPVALSEGRDPEGRFYPRARNAYFGWGVSLYLLGFLLAWQGARIHDGGLTGVQVSALGPLRPAPGPGLPPAQHLPAFRPPAAAPPRP